MDELVRAALPALNATGWALVHTLWVGALLWIVARCAVSLVSPQNPTIRYFIWYATFALILILPFRMGSLLMQEHARHRVWAVATADTVLARMSAELMAGSPENSNPIVESQAVRLEIERMHDQMNPTPVRSDAAITLALAMAFLAIAWGTLTIWRLDRFIRGWLRVRRISELARGAPPVSWTSALRKVCRRMVISRPIRLVTSHYIDSPFVFGWRKATVMIPTALCKGFSDSEAEAILAHEIAHVKQRDYVFNILQAVGEALLFFHPSVRWISARISEEREYRSDDIASRSIDGNWISYGAALAKLEASRPPEHAIALSARGGCLVARIRRLREVNAKKVRARSAWAVAILLIVVQFAVLTAATIPSGVVVDTAANAIMKYDLQTFPICAGDGCEPRN